jgi:hypothetical protein
LLWQQSGIKITEVYFASDMSADNSGGIIIGSENGILRINGQAELLWHVPEIPGLIIDNSLIAAGPSEIIFWYKDISDPIYSLYLQKVNINGELLWGDGVLITKKHRGKFHISLVPDGEHGAYISWVDSLKVYHYEHIDSSGNFLWTEDSLKFCYYCGDPNLALSDQNELISIYYYDRYVYGMKAQKFNKDGLKLWDENGVLFTLHEETYSFDLIADGTGGIIITWDTISTNRGVYAQRINRYGECGNITTVLEFNEDIAPISFLLNLNYPNPFNNQTSISYQINKSSHTVLKIYNITGKEVKTLVNEFQPKGNYQTSWNGKNSEGGDVTSGVYLCKLNVNDKVSTKKLILVK